MAAVSKPAAAAAASAPSLSEVQFPYRYVVGLTDIYIGTGKTPWASFVFDTTEQAQLAAKGLESANKTAGIVGYGRVFSDDSITHLTEVISADPPDELIDKRNRVITCAPKSTTVVARIETTAQLLYKVGKEMLLGQVANRTFANESSYSFEEHEVVCRFIDRASPYI